MTPELNGYSVTRRQQGFGLIELMVAMVIGLIIILGAGQLFLMGFQTFRQIELLSNKQAALTFATEMLIRDIRRANNDDIDWVSADGVLSVEYEAPNNIGMCSQGELVRREYYLSSSSTGIEGFSLMLHQTCDGAGGVTEPLVAGFSSGGFDVIDVDSDFGVYIVRFCLMHESGEMDCVPERRINFRAVNRTAAVQ